MVSPRFLVLNIGRLESTSSGDNSVNNVKKVKLTIKLPIINALGLSLSLGILDAISKLILERRSVGKIAPISKKKNNPTIIVRIRGKAGSNIIVSRICNSSKKAKADVGITTQTRRTP